MLILPNYFSRLKKPPFPAWCFFWGGAIDFEGGPSKFISAPPQLPPPQKMAPPQCPPSKHAIFLTTGGPPSNFPKCPPSKWLPLKMAPPQWPPPRKKHHASRWLWKPQGRLAIGRLDNRAIWRQISQPDLRQFLFNFFVFKGLSLDLLPSI